MEKNDRGHAERTHRRFPWSVQTFVWYTFGVRRARTLGNRNVSPSLAIYRCVFVSRPFRCWFCFVFHHRGSFSPRRRT